MPDVASKSRKNGQKKGKASKAPKKGKASKAPKGKNGKAPKKGKVEADTSAEDGETPASSSVGDLVAALGGRRPAASEGEASDAAELGEGEAFAGEASGAEDDEGEGEGSEGEASGADEDDEGEGSEGEAIGTEADAGERGADDATTGARETRSDDAAATDSAAEAGEGAVQLDDALPMDPDDDLRDIEGEASPRLVSIVESLLFAASKPMTVRDLRALLKEPTVRQVQLALKHLLVDTRDRGIVLAQVAGGFRLRTHPDNARWVQQLMAGKPVRLSRSQLEVLAVIAYRQPITKAELDHVRGVDCGAVLKVLLERELIRFVGRKEEPGRPHLYGTTFKFLEFFNLRSLRDMPALHEFRELTEESRAALRSELGDEAADLAEEREAMGQALLDFGDDEARADAAANEDASLEGEDASARADEGDVDAPSEDEDAGERADESGTDVSEGEGEDADASSEDEDAGERADESADADASSEDEDADEGDEDDAAATDDEEPS